jgi:putative mannosyl-glycoprotein endo-beta-N-acetylglucosaminidase
MSSFFYTKVLKPMGVREVDVVSHASTMAPPPVPSLRPGRGEGEDKGTEVSESDRNLPFESDFIESLEYNNPYGYLIMHLNKDFLSNGFVNEIQYIGINDVKYKYETVNTDRSKWYTIFIPYKYLNKGENILYFYMKDITYKTFVELGDEFKKQKISPKLIALENTDGVDVAFKLKMKHNSAEERAAFYDAIRDDLKEKITVSEIFTMAGSSGTEIEKDKYDVSIDEDNDELIIQFKNGKKIYQSLYIYDIDIAVEGFLNTKGTVILYEHADPLKYNWDTKGDNSLKITYGEDVNSIYLSEISNIELSVLDEKGDVKNTKTLEENKDYKKSYNELQIFSKAFESNKKYRLSLYHPSVKTVNLDIESPDLANVKSERTLWADDIKSDEDFSMSFIEDDKTWLSELNEIVLKDRNGYSYTMYPIAQKAIDDDKYRNNQNRYYELDKDNLTLKIDKKYFKNDSGRFILEFKAKGYDDSSVSFFRKKGGVFGTKDVKVEYRFLTDTDYSLELKSKTTPSTFVLRTYFDKRNNNVPKAESIITVKDQTTGVAKVLKPGPNEDFWSEYAGGNVLKIFAKNFIADHTYTVILQNNDYPTVVLKDIVAPSELIGELKEPSVKVKSVVKGNPVVISSNKEYVDAIQSIKISNAKGYSATKTDGFVKDNDKVSLDFEDWKKSAGILETVGSFSMTIAAKGYKDANIDFTIKDTNISADVEKDPDKKSVAVNFSHGKSPEYGYTDSLAYVELNNKKLSKTQYTRSALGSTLLINERLLLDGENKLILKSTLYDNIEVKFDFDNEKLRSEKEALLEKVSTPSNARKLRTSQVEALQSKIENAKTLRELRSAGIELDVALFGFAKAKLALKEEILEKINSSKLDGDTKRNLIETVNSSNDLQDLLEAEDKVDNTIAKFMAKEEEQNSSENNKIEEADESKDSKSKKTVEKPESKSDDIKKKTDPNNSLVIKPEIEKTEKTEKTLSSSKKSSKSSGGSKSKGRAKSTKTSVKDVKKVFTKNWFKLPNGKWTILGENIKSSWVKDGNYWFYMDNNSELADNQWIYIGGKWYFAKAGGYIAENEWISYKEKWYYAVSGGAIAQSAWENIGGKFYHFGTDGDLSVNTSVDGYQVDADGVRN